MGYGTKYNDICSQPSRASYKDKLLFNTVCDYKQKMYSSKTVTVKFDARDYFKFKEGRLVCRESR